MSDPAIEVRSLVVRCGGRNILQIEDFTVSRGQVVVILGPNGAGKSTLLKCLLGFVRADGGEVQRAWQSRLAACRHIAEPASTPHRLRAASPRRPQRDSADRS